MTHLLSPTVAFVLMASLMPVLPAQRVFVVDRLNRPGAHFTDLPAAEAAARHGDILALRADAGAYTAVTTGKGLTILGDGAAILVTHAQPLRVTGLPAGTDFVLQRCTLFLNQLPPAPALELLQCAGRVHLQQVDITAATLGSAVEVQGCAGVTVRDSRLSGAPALHARNSTVAVNASTLNGTAAWLGNPAGAAIQLQDATLHVSASNLAGGAAAPAWQTPVPGAPALSVVGSTAVIGGQSLVWGGRQATGQYLPALAGQASLVRLDPSAQVDGPGPFPGVVTLRSVVPTLNCPGVGMILPTFVGDPTASDVTLFGLPGGPTYGASFTGSLWLDPASVFAVPGVPGRIAIETVPQGLTFVVQVLSLTAAGIELSGPACLTAR